MALLDDASSEPDPAQSPLSMRHPAPAQILLTEEVQRARVFFRSLAIVIGFLLAFLPFLPGPSWMRAATAVFAGTLLAVALITLAIVRDEKRYTPNLIVAVGTVGSALGVMVTYYLGLFSAAAAMLTVGIYFF